MKKNEDLEILDVENIGKMKQIIIEEKNNAVKSKIKIVKKRRLRNTVINTLLIIIILVCLIQIGRWFYDNYRNNKVKDSFKETAEKVDNINVKKIKEEDKIDFKKLKEQNKDTVAWIKVNNTNINYPVVKSTDNSKYLNTSFDNSYNGAGWIFMDYRNKMDENDKNIIIYGHNRRDKSMFGTLSSALKSDWYNNEDNKTILFITENGIEKYEVFSVYETEVEDYYITTNFDEDSFKDFLGVINSRSYHNFNTPIDSSKSIITLSTCSGRDKYRIVLHAIKKD